MLNINLRIYTPRWKKSGSTKCIDPNQPMDVHDVPLSSSVGGPTLKVIRVTSAISTNAHYNLLLDAKEVDSLHYTYMVPQRVARRMKPGLLCPAKEMKFSRLWKQRWKRR